jgi:hypothetical protein
MSMTSNSPAERALARASRVPALASALLLAALAAPAGAEPPLPARAAVAAPPAATVQVAPESRRVRIVAARLIAVPGADRRLRAFLAARPGVAADAAVIAVQVAQPFAGRTRTASPVILIDGQPIESLVSTDVPGLIYARPPARRQGAGPGIVQVGWLGDLQRTLSPPARLSPR